MWPWPEIVALVYSLSPVWGPSSKPLIPAPSLHCHQTSPTPSACSCGPRPVRIHLPTSLMFFLYCQWLRLVPGTFSAPGVLVCFCFALFCLTSPKCHWSLRFGNLLSTGAGVCEKLYACTGILFLPGCVTGSVPHLCPGGWYRVLLY